MRTADERPRGQETLENSKFMGALASLGISLEEFQSHLIVPRRKMKMNKNTTIGPPLLLHFKHYREDVQKDVEFGVAFEYLSPGSTLGIAGRQLFSNGWGGTVNFDMNHLIWEEAEITFIEWTSDFTKDYFDFLTQKNGTPPPAAGN